jgi:hypothetical protein
MQRRQLCQNTQLGLPEPCKAIMCISFFMETPEHHGLSQHFPSGGTFLCCSSNPQPCVKNPRRNCNTVFVLRKNERCCPVYKHNVEQPEARCAQSSSTTHGCRGEQLKDPSIHAAKPSAEKPLQRHLSVPCMTCRCRTDLCKTKPYAAYTHASHRLAETTLCKSRCSKHSGCLRAD